MSETDFTSDSSTDSEFDSRLEEVEIEKWRDEESSRLMEEMRLCNIRSSTFDGETVKSWLQGDVTLEDVIVCGRLKKQNSVLLLRPITKERVEEIRTFAKKVIDFYGESLRYSSYVDRVTACIIRYEYNL